MPSPFLLWAGGAVVWAVLRVVLGGLVSELIIAFAVRLVVVSFAGWLAFRGYVLGGRKVAPWVVLSF